MLIEFLKNLISPARCYGCKMEMNERSNILCYLCCSMISPLASRTLLINKKYEMPVVAIGAYDDPLRFLILGKQWSNYDSAYILGELLWKYTDLSQRDFDIIVPVPLHWMRYAWRWYNQTEVMANVISKYSGKPVVHAVAKKIKTVHQTGLSRAHRMVNITQDVFILTDQSLQCEGKKILFVDDLITTGTTIQAVARTLLPVSPQALLLAVGCRTI